EVIPEGAIGREFDLLSVDPHRRIGVRAAIENDLRVDVHEEAALALHAERLRAPARTDAAEETGRSRGQRLEQHPGKPARTLAMQFLHELLAEQLIDLL